MRPKKSRLEKTREATEAAPKRALGRSRLKPLLAVSVLAVATLALYSPVGTHPFINYDDQQYVVNNWYVHGGLSWQTLRWALTATNESNWHPLTWWSHALDYELFGLNPAGHHWTSVVIHTMNVVLLFWLLQWATGAMWRSLIVAALFALHPLNVESVAWVAERKNVLSTLFFLLALGAYGWYARRPGLRRYILTALFFVLGLASKPMVITLPFVLLLVDYWPLRRIEDWSEPSPQFPVPQRKFAHLVLEKLPLLAFSAGSAVITIVAQTKSVVPTLVLPLAVRLEDAVYAYGMYLLKTIWPANLALIYPHPGRTLAAWQIVLAGFAIIFLSLAAWKLRSSRPYFAVGWLWFLGTAVPIIGIIQVGVQVIADRYAYVPLIGIFIALVWAASDLADNFMVPFDARAAATTVVVIALSFATWYQIGYWKTTVDLWTHALQATKDNSIAEHHLANELFRLRRYKEWIFHLQNYARLEPLDPEAHAKLGAYLQDRGRLQEAINEYEDAIRANAIQLRSGAPGLETGTLAITYTNLSVIYTQFGDQGKARENTQKALATDAAAVDAMIDQLRQAVTATPTAQGYLRLGLLLYQRGSSPEADEAFIRARRLDANIVVPPVATEAPAPAANSGNP